MESRFHTNTGPYSAAEIAQAIGAELWLNGKQVTDTELANIADFMDVASLDSAGKGDLAFLDNPKYIPQFEVSSAGGCIVHAKHTSRAPSHMLLLVCKEPYAAYAKAAALFYPPIAFEPEISLKAHIDEHAIIGGSVRIEPGAVIEAGATIGAYSHIGANAHIAKQVIIGEYCSVGANSTISHAMIGNHVTIHRGVHIGQDGFGWAPSKQGVIKVPQLGQVVIGNHVDIGSGTCIDRGAGPDTVIGDHTKIDNLVQIGHNVQIGQYCFLAGQTGIAGSAKIGNGVMMGGHSGMAGHITMGDNAKLAGYSATMVDIPAGETYVGAPARPGREFFKIQAILNRMLKGTKA